MGVDLTPMAKDGEVLLVHPTCVQAHHLAGWRVCDAPAADPAPAQAEPEAPAAAKKASKS